MKVLIIGGTGHVGTYLTRKLVANGHDVYVGTRGNTQKGQTEYFQGAKCIFCNAGDRESLQALKEYHFDTIVEFPGLAYNVWQELEGSVSHIVACGSLWMFGYPHKVPTPEVLQERCFYEGYAVRFDQIQEMQAASGRAGTVFTAIMPPNICGAGKIPLDQYGWRELKYHREMAEGKTVYIPDGPECLISPCDAEDIASLFALAMENREKAAGQLFNAGSDYALTISEYIQAYADIYGVEIPVERVSWDRYIKEINPAQGAWWHFYAHMAPDITKAKTLLGYQPKYTPEQTMRRAVEWMKAEGLL
ncbi:MAG: NAD(P)-dependent oxidoreductase [Clostridia bacterium]|nr:NAD(P)-dependent oxidoreductase [Clostridia bacterium]